MSAQDRRDERDIAEARMIEWGVVDPDQPLPGFHARHVARMRREFTATERQRIRWALNLEPKP